MATATKPALKRLPTTQHESEAESSLMPFEPANLQITGEAALLQPEPPPEIFGLPITAIRTLECGRFFRFRIPLGQVDSRKLLVLARPTSLLIEMRSANVINMHEAGVTEEQRHRFTRELQFRTTLKRGSIVVKMIENELEITCAKAEEPEDAVWSDLIRFDSRSSLGCV